MSEEGTTVKKEGDQKNVLDALNGMRELNEKVGGIKKAMDEGRGMVVEKFKKMEVDFDSINSKIEEAEIKRDAAEKKLHEIEKESEKVARLYHSKDHSDNVKVHPEIRKLFDAHYESFDNFIANPAYSHSNECLKFNAKNFSKTLKQLENKGIPVRVLKDLNTYSNVDGGYLVPIPLYNRIIEPIVEMNPMRQYCTVIPMSSKALDISNLTIRPEAFWVGEGQTIQPSNVKFGKGSLVTKKLGTVIGITNELLEDNAFNVENYVIGLARVAFSRGQQSGFVNGKNDALEIEGLAVNPNIGIVPSGDAAALTFDSLKIAHGEIKEGYNLRYAFNRRTRSYISLLKEATTGRYIWQQGNVAAGIPSEIDGLPYFVAPDFDDITANFYPVFIGDFSAYWIGDRVGLSMIRDPYSKKLQDSVEIMLRQRIAGKVTLSEAFKKIKIATS